MQAVCNTEKRLACICAMVLLATGVYGAAENKTQTIVESISSLCCYLHGVNKPLLRVLAAVPKPEATVQTVVAARLSAQGLSQRSGSIH